MKPEKFNQNQGTTANKGPSQGQQQTWDKSRPSAGSGMNQSGKTQSGQTQGTNLNTNTKRDK